MTERHNLITTHTDTGTPCRVTLDLSRIATDEQVITREDWAAIPKLLGSPDTNMAEWSRWAPAESDWEYVKMNGSWYIMGTHQGQRRNMGQLNVTLRLICDLAIPLLTARDSRVPEVGQ